MMWDKAKQEQLFTEAYDQYSEAIFRYCYYRVFDKEKAKDVMQEAYFKTWQYLVKGNEIENIRAFVYRTAKNLIIDASRKKKHASLEQMMEQGFTPNIDSRQSTQDYFSAKEVIEVIKSLDDKYKDVLLLKYVDGFSLKEIAEITEERDNSVSVRLHRGITQVKQILKDKERGN